MEIKPGYHIFWGSSDTAERALGALQSAVKEAEADYDMVSINFSLKDDPNRHSTWHAIQVMWLTPKEAPDGR
jgi:hypothetical protein